MIFQIAFKSVEGKRSNNIKSLKELGRARLLKDKLINLDSDIENCFFLSLYVHTLSAIIKIVP